MQIRRHNSSDFAQIAELRWFLQASETQLNDNNLKAEFITNYRQQLAASETLNDTVHWVIDDQGALVGVMTIRTVRKELSPTEKTKSWGYLTNSFVLPRRRNSGLGAELLKSVIDWATAKNLELLIVWPSEASYPFYRRAGFTGRHDPLELVLHPDVE